ncbi:unnamed protein product, partial [Prorocentrum cordatum]
ETATSPVAARAAHAAIIGPARRAGRAPGREGARPRVAREQAQGRQDQEPAHDLRGRGVRELLQQARVRVQGGRPGSFRVVAGSGHDAARHVLGRQREYLDRRGPGRRGRRLQAGPEGHPRDGGVRGLRGRRRLRRRVGDANLGSKQENMGGLKNHEAPRVAAAKLSTVGTSTEGGPNRIVIVEC